MGKKAFLVPYNSNKEIFIQDRTDYKPPPWGFFGGTIEEGEIPVQAMLREAKEELDLDLVESDLISLGNIPTVYDGIEVARHFFLYKTDQIDFTVLEGSGGLWVSLQNSEKYLKTSDRINALEQAIKSI